MDIEERAQSLIDQWEQLKKEFWEQPWVKRRVKLIQKRNRTTAEEKELDELCERESKSILYGTLEDSSMGGRFKAALEVLEKAARIKEKPDGK